MTEQPTTDTAPDTTIDEQPPVADPSVPPLTDTVGTDEEASQDETSHTPDGQPQQDLDQWAPYDPFRDEDDNPASQQHRVTKAINLDQLRDEIAHDVKREVSVVSATYNPTTEVGEDNPTVVFVFGENLPEGRVRKVIEEHEPDYTYGMTEEQQSQRTVVGKIQAGETLTAEEVTQAFKALMFPS